MLMRRKGLLLIANAIGEINKTCPAITPAYGSEKITNTGFEGTYTAGVAPNWSRTRGTWTESSDVHGGAAAQQINNPAGNSALGKSNVFAMTAGQWIQIVCWDKILAGVGVINFVQQFGGFLKILPDTQLTDATYTQHLYTLRIPTAGDHAFSISTLVDASADTHSALFDDVSVQVAAVSALAIHLGRRPKRAGTYTCTPTVADNTQCGILLAYIDASNFVQIIVDRQGTDQAKLVSCIGGTYTVATSGNITYGAGKILKVIVTSGGTYSLYYDGVQVGTDQAISETTLGAAVYGFSSYASNAVGLVQTTALEVP